MENTSITHALSLKISNLILQRKYFEEIFSKKTSFPSPDGDPSFRYTGHIFPENILWLKQSGFDVFTTRCLDSDSEKYGFEIYVITPSHFITLSNEEMAESTTKYENLLAEAMKNSGIEDFMSFLESLSANSDDDDDDDAEDYDEDYDDEEMIEDNDNIEDSSAEKDVRAELIKKAHEFKGKMKTLVGDIRDAASSMAANMPHVNPETKKDVAAQANKISNTAGQLLKECGNLISTFINNNDKCADCISDDCDCAQTECEGCDFCHRTSKESDSRSNCAEDSINTPADDSDGPIPPPYSI